MGARRSARRAAHSPAMHVLARAGLTARGVIYILLGWVAILVAVGHSAREADQSGALQLLAGKPYGLVSLWLLGIGFVAYALWRFSEAAFGVAGEGNGAGPRLKSLVRGLVYAALAYLTFQVIAGVHSNEATKQQDATASVMHHAGGPWLVGIVGLIIVIAGVALIAQGIRRKFMRQLETSRMTRRERRIVEWLGVIGTTARGVVFALAGVLVIDAAVTYSPSKARGVDGALNALRNQPFGEFLLLLAALGLLIFGIYGLCEARWRRV
jgi:succinate dehydrogenase/fumarate reductase cytochrome b subunit